jgi:hypothetical protein
MPSRTAICRANCKVRLGEEVQAIGREEEWATYKMTNFVGKNVTKKKLRAKQAKAARIKPPKIRSRSQLLTAR